MAQKDVISKRLLKNLAKDIARYILNIELESDVEFIDKEFTKIEKRDADLVLKDKNSIYHIEIQNNNHPNMESRMLRYLSDIVSEYPKLDVKQYLLYIGKEPLKMKNNINKSGLNFFYDIIDIKSISCETLIKSQNPSAVVLAVLCDFDTKDPQEIINTIIKRLRELTQDREFKEYIEMVSILSTNRGLEEKFNKGVDMFTIEWERNPIYKRGLERGLESGLNMAKFENAMIFIEKFNIAIDDVARELNIKKDELVNYIKSKKQGSK